jgi:hypothetical protein
MMSGDEIGKSLLMLALFLAATAFGLGAITMKACEALPHYSIKIEKKP